MKKLAIEILNKESEYENKIKTLELEVELLKEEVKRSKNEALRLRLVDNGKYCSLTDFCRISRGLLFIKETELKQWLCQQSILSKLDEKYYPATEQDTCILEDGELYIKYSFVRNTIMLLRTLVYIDDSETVKLVIGGFEKNKDAIVEQMANTVYVSYKQNSNEFRHHKENKFFIQAIEEELNININ